MPRAIQDSDDDGDFDSPSPASERTPARNHQIRDALSRSQVTAPGGTSSTEALQREIAAAHREVIEKSALPTFVPPEIRSSPSMHRRNTMTELTRGSPSTRNTQRRSTMVTYGSSSRRRQSTYEDGAFESMRGQEVVAMEAQVDSSPGDVELVASGTTHGRLLEDSGRQRVIAGSLEQEFAFHNPDMFSTSDTVPDGTLDGQRLVEAAIAANVHYGLTHDGNANVPEEKELEDPSPPWSDFLQSPLVRLRVLSFAHTEFMVQNARASKENTQVSPIHHSTPEPNSSLCRSKSFGQPRLSQSSDQNLGDIIPRQDPSSASTKKRRISLADIGPRPMGHSPKRLRREPADEADELAHHDDNLMTRSQKVDHSIQESIRAVRASKAAKAQNNSSIEPLNSDDVLVGLPEERNQPRPSRSRSSRLAVEEPTDYYVTPEKAAKQRATRRKTEDASTIGRLKLSVAEKRQRMAEMGFSPTSSTRALKDNGNDLDRAIGALSTEDQVQATGIAFEEEIKDMAKDYVAAKSENGQLEETPRAEKGAVVAIENRPSSTVLDSPDTNTTQTKRKRGRPPKARPSSVRENATEGAQGANVMHKARGSQDGLKSDDHASMMLLEPDEDRQNASPLKRHPSPTVNPTPPGSARPVMTTAESNKLEERAAQIPEAQESLPKKRGRGRPRKHQSPEPTTAARHEATNSDMQATRGAEVSQGSESEEGRKETPEHGSIREAPVSTPLNVTSPESRSALQTAIANAPQTPDMASAKKLNRSPAGKGKVPYRVGLSRRARIAPLLKIVKK
ncbi:hypothetical protein IWX47DRAFT_847754 [Phyllosticta citricarpa]